MFADRVRTMSFGSFFFLAMTALQASGAAVEEVLFTAGKDSIAASAFDTAHNLLYIGAGKRLFKVSLPTRSYTELLFPGGTLHWIETDSFSPNLLLVAAEKGVYISEDYGESFSRIYTSPVREDETFFENLFVLRVHDAVLIGTESGLFTAAMHQWVWARSPGIPAETAVFWITQAGPQQVFFAVTERGVYKSIDAFDTSKRVFSAGTVSDEETDAEGEECERTKTIPSCMAYDESSSLLYMGTTAGFYISEDGGEHFKKQMSLPVAALPVYRMQVDPENPAQVYLATGKGMYTAERTAEGPSPAFFAQANEPVRGIHFLGSDNRAVLVTEKEARLTARDKAFPEKIAEHIAEASTGQSRPASLSRDENKRMPAGAWEDSEPGIEEIRSAALCYNEVSPEKITQWRKLAQVRALFPEVSVDYDTNIDIYQTVANTRITKGPFDWGVSAKWDVGDLVWNPYQKDIDVRSRLNTQLRIEILEEVHRLYFERKKLRKQLEVLTGGSEEYEKIRLRIAELTAALDGYTGGFFSRRITQLRREEPAVNQKGCYGAY